MGAAAIISANSAKEKCQVIAETYDVKGATVEQAREYASCVYRLHGATASPAEILAAKALVLLVLTGALVGGYKGFRFRSICIGELLAFLMFGTLCAAVIGVFLVLAYLGLKFVFS